MNIYLVTNYRFRSSLMDAVETAALKSIELGQKHGKKSNHDSK